MADSHFNKFSDDDTSQTKKKVKLLDNGDGTFSMAAALVDSNGARVGVFDGAINIHDPHNHSIVINEAFHQHTLITTTLSANAPSQSTKITVLSATGFAVGDFIHIENGTVEVRHPRITIIVGNILTLDAPLDNSFIIGDSVTKSILNMNVLGSLSTAQSFKVAPMSGTVWHLMRILIEMTHDTAGDNGLFGNLAQLTNGVVLRLYNGATGKYSTFTNWKTNGAIASDVYDVSYVQRSGGGGSYGTNARGTFYDTGAVVRLDGTTGDFLEILVQDNLSGLISFRAKAQGHIEGH